jgi:SAM-dependent methyltransferase
MISYLSKTSAIAVLFVLTGTQTFASWGVSEKCHQLLTQRADEAVTIPVRFLSKPQSVTTFEESLRALRHTSDDVNKIETLNELIAPLVQKATTSLYNKVGRIYYKNPGLRELYFDVLSLMGPQTPTKERFDTAFEGPLAAELYKDFASPLQYYISVMTVSYLALRTELFSSAHPLRVVELGVGIGDTTKAINDIFNKPTIIAVDRSVTMMRYYKQRFPANRFLYNDFGKTKLNIESDSQDVVISVAAASLYVQPTRFKKLAEDVHRLLRPGGYFIFDIGLNHSALRKGQSLEQFLQEMQKLGFETEPSAGILFQREDRIYCPVLLRKKEI